MAVPVKQFRLQAKRIIGGETEGFYLDLEEHLVRIDATAKRHLLVPLRVDSATSGCTWGRIQVTSELPKGSAILLHFYASDFDNPIFSNATQMIDPTDGLLGAQTGRYLFLWLEVLGASEGWIKQITVWTPGNVMMRAFPEVYRDQGGFFERYLSIFSSIYFDFQGKVDSLHDLVDLEHAPNEMLPLIGSWLGIDLSPMLYDHEVMREILEEASYLHTYKATKKVIARIAEIVTGVHCIIIERNQINESGSLGDGETLNRLYGSTVYDYTLLIPLDPDALLRKQLLALLYQFQPVRARANIVFLRSSSILDTYIYLDGNAVLQKMQDVQLDRNVSLNGGGCLK